MFPADGVISIDGRMLRGKGTLHKKATIHQVTTGYYTTLWLSPKCQRMKGYLCRWLAGGYDLEIGYF